MRGREESEEVREMRGEGEGIKRKKEEEGGEKMGSHTHTPTPSHDRACDHHNTSKATSLCTHSYTTTLRIPHRLNTELDFLCCIRCGSPKCQETAEVLRKILRPRMKLARSKIDIEESKRSAVVGN